MSGDAQVVVHPSKQALADAAGARLLTALLDAQAARGRAQVVLTGGSMGSAIIASVVADAAHAAVDWTTVRVWWGDERYLATGDDDRNDTQNDDAGLSALGLDPGKVMRVHGPDTSGSAQQSAASYAATLHEWSDEPFDVVLLGVGPDGHVASLFPQHPAQRSEGVEAIAVHDSPKPPPDRVSLTYERLNRAREVWFLVAGRDKADAVAQALRPGTDRWDVPASGVQGTEATRWLLDADAATAL
ncbi:MAG: 6-phosphogluconolactonase [Actinomycetota bacterium]|nr:6-phosphogluconolactonase [Actinomycetota bacterium]